MQWSWWCLWKRNIIKPHRSISFSHSFLFLSFPLTLPHLCPGMKCVCVARVLCSVYRIMVYRATLVSFQDLFNWILFLDLFSRLVTLWFTSRTECVVSSCTLCCVTSHQNSCNVAISETPPCFIHTSKCWSCQDANRMDSNRNAHLTLQYFSFKQIWNSFKKKKKVVRVACLWFLVDFIFSNFWVV